MTRPRDSMDRGTGTLPPGQEDDSPTPGQVPADSVSLSEHQRLIEEERKRRAGQERKHQQEKDRLQREIDELRRQPPAYSAPAPSPIATEIDFSNINPQDPALPVLQRLQSEVRTLRQERDLERQQQQLQREIQDALVEAAEEGVPDDYLDTSSVPAIRASIREWKKDKRINELEESVKKLGTGNPGTPGSPTPPASAPVVPITGNSPVARTVDDQIAEVLKEQAEIRNSQREMGTKAAMLHDATLALKALQEWKSAHPRNEPMPLGQTRRQ